MLLGITYTVYSYFEKGYQRKMCVQQSRKVIWDMINVIILLSTPLRAFQG